MERERSDSAADGSGGAWRDAPLASSRDNDVVSENPARWFAGFGGPGPLAQERARRRARRSHALDVVASIGPETRRNAVHAAPEPEAQCRVPDETPAIDAEQPGETLAVEPGVFDADAPRRSRHSEFDAVNALAGSSPAPAPRADQTPPARTRPDATHSSEPSPRGSIAGTWPEDSLGRAMLRMAGIWWRGTAYLSRVSREVMPQLTVGPARFDAEAWVARRIDAMGWRARSLRVGMVDPGPWGAALMNAPGLFRVEWDVLSTWDWASAAKRRCLDAVLKRDASGALAIITIECSRREAAWYDWSTQRPVSFSSVFPGRVDCARVTLPGSLVDDGVLEQTDSAELLRSLVESAAVLSRTPARLGLRERLMGRAPIPLGTGSHDLEVASRECVRASMLRLARVLASVDCAGLSLPAARAVSAYVMGADDEILPGERALALSRAGGSLDEEVESLLRIAAGAVSGGDYENALPRLVRAEWELRNHSLRSSSDQAAFVQAEVETGRGTPLSLGRVAAGICLAAAQMDGEKLRYFRDDFADDLNACAWMRDREAFVALTKDLFAQLIEARNRDAERAKAA